jgi:flavin-dependent dehydrogenase
VTTDAGEEIAARWLLDASGQATVVGKHLGIRRVLTEHRKVAWFGHFEGVERRPGIEGGFPTMVMFDEGWFWVIPIDERRTSIGLVMDTDLARGLGVPPDRMLSWGIARAPYMQRITDGAAFPETTWVNADFSYRCSPYAGPGYFLIGDAATFMDPIFSTGVCLGMMSGAQAAEGVLAMLRRGAHPERIRRGYIRYVEESSAPFFRLVELYYDHSFRELFLEGEGPLDVHRAVLSVLAGDVFPRPPFSLRWRLALFELLVRLNRRFPLVPRRERFSLLGAPACREPRAEPATSAAHAG